MNLSQLVEHLSEHYPQEIVPLRHIAYEEVVPLLKPAPRFLFRGERDWYPTTLSTMHRLLERSAFSIEETDDFLENASSLAASLVLETVSPIPKPHSPGWEYALNEIHSWVQHYELPVMSIDLTSDLKVAAYFAALENISGRGRIGVVETSSIVGENKLLRMDQGKSPRSRNQSGYALRMYNDRPDLKNGAHFSMKWFDFEFESSDSVFSNRPDLLTPESDPLLDLIIFRLSQVSCQHERVQEVFDSVRRRLLRY